MLGTWKYVPPTYDVWLLPFHKLKPKDLTIKSWLKWIYFLATYGEIIKRTTITILVKLINLIFFFQIEKKRIKKNISINSPLVKIYRPETADYIIMTNRASFKISDKKTCFTKYPGKNILEVSKQKLIFSVLRKLD